MTERVRKAPSSKLEAQKDGCPRSSGSRASGLELGHSFELGALDLGFSPPIFPYFPRPTPSSMLRGSGMAEARIDELKTLLPQCLLPDWVKLGSRLVRLLRDQHHAERHDALLARLREEALKSIALREARRINVPQVTYPPELPVTMRKDEIVKAMVHT